MSADSVHVLPPPGPLVWLHPELGAVDAHLRADARVRAGENVVDLAEVRLPEHAPAPNVALPADAWGRALAPLLRVRWPSASFTSAPGLGLEAELARRPDSGQWLPVRGGADVDRTLDECVARYEAQPGAGPVPVFLGGDESGRAPTTRLATAWWGLFPGEHLPPARRARVHRLVRALRPDRYLAYLELENAALAGVDLYSHALLGRGRRLAVEADVERSRAPRAARPWVFAVSGIDGSGKSTHAAALVQHLAARGLRTTTLKMYRHGVFHETVTDLNRRSAGGRRLDLWRLQRLAKGFDSVRYLHEAVRPALDCHDALVFDRWINTHLVAGPGRILHDPWTRELLSGYPPLDHLFLLDVPASVAVERLGAREQRTIDENPYMLGRFARGLRDRAARDRARHGTATLLDARAPFEENAERVRATVDRLIAEAQA